MHQPVTPSVAIIDSAFESWKQLPGNFSKHDWRPATFTLAALAGRDDVEITHAHLDRHDRPTLVFLLHGEDTTAVFLMAHEAGTHVMIKGTSMGALAPGLELLDGCFESTDRVA